MIKIILNSIDVSELVSSINWSGNCNDISRTLNISYLYAIYDYYAPKNYPNLGDNIYFYYNGIELFRGKIYSISNNGKQGTIYITCYDDSIRLSKSTGTFNFKDIFAENITKKVLQEVGIDVGVLADTKITQKKIYDNENLYNIIKESYNNASLQNGKKYMNYMQEGKFYVVQVGKDLGITLDDETDIININFKEDANNIINKVKIYDENNQYLDFVEDTNLISKFGVFQNIYTKEVDKQARTVAKEMLKNIEQSVSVESLGNYKCIAGYSINILEKSTNINGKFEITSDSHKFSNGQHIMNLELSYKGETNYE